MCSSDLAGWTFVVWGLLNGLFLVVEILLPSRREEKSHPIVDAGRIVWTLSLFCLALAVFRADSLADAGVLLQRIASWADQVEGGTRIRERGVWMLIVALVLHYLPLSWYRAAQQWLLQRSPFAQGAMAACSLGFLGVVMTAGQPFIYFQF